MLLAKGFDAVAEAGLTLERAVDHRALAHAMPSVNPTERDVHHKAKCPEAFATLWWAPDQYQPIARQKALDRVVGVSNDAELIERHRDQSGRRVGLRCLLRGAYLSTAPSTARARSRMRSGYSLRARAPVERSYSAAVRL